MHIRNKPETRPLNVPPYAPHRMTRHHATPWRRTAMHAPRICRPPQTSQTQLTIRPSDGSHLSQVRTHVRALRCSCSEAAPAHGVRACRRVPTRACMRARTHTQQDRRCCAHARPMQPALSRCCQHLSHSYMFPICNENEYASMSGRCNRLRPGVCVRACVHACVPGLWNGLYPGVHAFGHACVRIHACEAASKDQGRTRTHAHMQAHTHARTHAHTHARTHRLSSASLQQRRLR